MPHDDYTPSTESAGEPKIDPLSAFKNDPFRYGLCR